MSTSTPNFGSRADFLDTGQWHLAVDISINGFGAWLVPDVNLGRPPKEIIREEWNPSREGLLARIEDVVYDNPTILDDYSADIIVECERQLWLPKEYYPTDDDCAEAFDSIFGTDLYEVMINDLGEEKNAFMLIPGLKSFMQRSFPGARIWSQQALLRDASANTGDARKCLIDIRRNSADYILTDREKLLSASTHQWKTDADIVFALVNILTAYGISTAETDIIFSGLRETRHAIGKSLSPYFKSISQKNHDLDGISIPTAVYLAINRKNRHANHTR